ncbi:MAG: hypothetical protein WA063_03050 [Minisyncoccia bacterium]
MGFDAKHGIEKGLEEIGVHATKVSESEIRASLVQVSDLNFLFLSALFTNNDISF